jgi:protein-histidine pros-kinase
MSNPAKSDPNQTSDAHTSGQPDREALSHLIIEMQNAAEAEKSALAKELHDELGGLITAAKMDMQWLTSHLGGSVDAARDEKMKSVMQMLNQAMTLKRRVVENLRPSLLDHFGLGVALRSHFEEGCRAVGLECVASLPEESLELPPATQLALFRIAQEVLSAVITGGNARHIELVIEPEEGGYSMLIGDDGAGRNEALDRALVALRHRIGSLGGTLDSRNQPGEGNRIRTFVPQSPAKSG